MRAAPGVTALPALCVGFAACNQGASGGFAGMKPPDGGASVEEPVGPCPVDMVYIEPTAAEVTLGEDDPAWAVDDAGQPYQHTLTEGSLAPRGPYCVARFPFPGEGEEWATEAAYMELMPALEEELAAAGRRLCSVSELLLAAAGPENWRFALHPDERRAGCEEDDHSPSRAIGGHAACVSPLGVHDFNVRSSWARVLDWERAALEDGVVPPGEVLDYGVYGGTARDDTFYPPTNFALHFHPPGLMEGGGYRDDDLRVCADPDDSTAADAERWDALVSAFVESGSTYRAWLR